MSTFLKVGLTIWVVVAAFVMAVTIAAVIKNEPVNCTTTIRSAGKTNIPITICEEHR